MSHTEEALQERIKELTCLYEVSSIIVSANVSELDDTLQSIANSLKKAFQFPDYTEIAIKTSLSTVKTGAVNETIGLTTDIKVFNKLDGKIMASLTAGKSTFLKEEQQLLDNVAPQSTY